MKPLLVLLPLLSLSVSVSATDAFADDRAAEVLVERAVAAYRAADYAKAGAFFLEAYRLSNAPAQLRNAAKAYQQAQDLDQAEALWGELGSLSSLSPSERSEAEAQSALIAERRKAIAAEAEARLAREEAARSRTATATIAQAPPPSLPPPPPPPPLMESANEKHGFRLPVGPVITIATGLAVVIGGGAFYYHSERRLEHLDDQLDIKDSDQAIVGINLADAEAELHSVNRERTIAYSLAGVGVGAVIAGALWWLLDLDW